MTSPLPGTLISALPPAIGLTGAELVPIVQGGTTKSTTTAQIASLGGGSSSGGGATQLVTGSGTVTVGDLDGAILISKSVPSATPIQLPAVSGRNNLPLRIADILGTGGDIMITPSGSETIMGLADWTVSSGGSAGTGGSITLYPSTLISGWYMAGTG